MPALGAGTGASDGVRWRTSDALRQRASDKVRRRLLMPPILWKKSIENTRASYVSRQIGYQRRDE